MHKKLPSCCKKIDEFLCKKCSHLHESRDRIQKGWCHSYMKHSVDHIKNHHSQAVTLESLSRKLIQLTCAMVNIDVYIKLIRVWNLLKIWHDSMEIESCVRWWWGWVRLWIYCSVILQRQWRFNLILMVEIYNWRI